MATVNRKYIAFESGKYKVRDSQTDEVIFTAVKIGGTGGKDLTLVGGNFDFAAAKLVNIAAGTANGEALSFTQLGAANGVASLDGGGKVPVSQLPSAVMTYEGVYNATTNSPALSDVAGYAGGAVPLSAGQVFRVGTAGTQDFGSGAIVFNVGDYVIYNGTVWEKSDTTDAVASVAGKTGVVTLVAADVTDFNAAAQAAAISQVITNGVTTKAPSEDAVFDALAGKSNTGHTHVAADVTDFSSAAQTATISQVITNGVTTKAPSEDAVFDALALKADITYVDGVIANDKAFTNDNASPITIRQLAYIKANGNVDLLTAALATFDTTAVIVKDASIASAASGKCYVEGDTIPGFTGLTPSKPVYAHISTPGSYTQDPSTITSGNLYQVGRAISATEMVYAPLHIIEL